MFWCFWFHLIEKIYERSWILAPNLLRFLPRKSSFAFTQSWCSTWNTGGTQKKLSKKKVYLVHTFLKKNNTLTDPDIEITGWEAFILSKRLPTATEKIIIRAPFNHLLPTSIGLQSGCPGTVCSALSTPLQPCLELSSGMGFHISLLLAQPYWFLPLVAGSLPTPICSGRR